MATYKLLLLPGDGIGPEVMGEVKKLIGWMNGHGMGTFETEEGLVGGSCYDAHKVSITEETMAKAHAADAVIFGSVGGPKWDSVPYDVRPEAGLLRLRKDLALYANLRPAVTYPALADASALKRELVEGLDIIILRELTGGVYFGEPKTITDLGNGQKRAVDTQVYDTYEIERIGRVAFELARKRRNKVTSMEKRNVMKTGVLWNEVITAVHQREFKDVTLGAPAGRLGRHAAREESQAVRRHRHRQPVRRHAVRYRRDAHRLARHARVGLARRHRSEDQEAQGAVRAGARLCAGHRRQGHRQSDRDDRIVRDGAALLVRHGQGSRPDRQGDRFGAAERAAHRRHHVVGLQAGRHEGDGRRDHRRDGRSSLRNRCERLVQPLATGTRARDCSCPAGRTGRGSARADW